MRAPVTAVKARVPSARQPPSAGVTSMDHRNSFCNRNTPLCCLIFRNSVVNMRLLVSCRYFMTRTCTFTRVSYHCFAANQHRDQGCARVTVVSLHAKHVQFPSNHNNDSHSSIIHYTRCGMIRQSSKRQIGLAGPRPRTISGV